MPRQFGPAPARIGRCLFQCGFDTATPPFAFFFSLSRAFLFSIFHPPRYFSFYSRRYTKIVLFLYIFHNNSGHYSEVLLVCISFQVSERKSLLLPLCSVVLKALKFSPFFVDCAGTLHLQSEYLALVRKRNSYSYGGSMTQGSVIAQCLVLLLTLSARKEWQKHRVF